MAYNPYQYNNYGNMNMQQQIQQQISQLQNLQNQYNQMYQQPQNQQPITRGSFIQVKDYQEVINYPTDASGMPTLFMNENNGVFWVKKFIDGSNKIQAYSFAPINDFSTNTINNTNQDEKASKNENNNDIIDNLMGRMTKLEDTQEEIIKLLKGRANNNGKSYDNSKTTNDKQG